MPEEDKGLVDDVGVEDSGDVRVEVTDVEVVVVDVVEEEVEEEEDEEEDEDEEEEEEEEVEKDEIEEEEDVVPSSEAPCWAVKMSLTASWPAESIIWIW
jgi:CO dehydrogenase/acetyl-CoA synthase beta subunit